MSEGNARNGGGYGASVERNSVVVFIPFKHEGVNWSSMPSLAKRAS
jgi:hypothetical protein